MLKQKLIKDFVGVDDYLIILRRCHFVFLYDMKIANNFPKEECCEFLKRKLITHKPNPNHSDYRNMNSNTGDKNIHLINIDRIVSYIRKRYGYCRRNLLMSQSSSSLLSDDVDFTTRTTLTVNTKSTRSILPTEKFVGNNVLLTTQSSTSTTIIRPKLNHFSSDTIIRNSQLPQVRSSLVGLNSKSFHVIKVNSKPEINV